MAYRSRSSVAATPPPPPVSNAPSTANADASSQQPNTTAEDEPFFSFLAVVDIDDSKAVPIFLFLAALILAVPFGVTWNKSQSTRSSYATTSSATDRVITKMLHQSLAVNDLPKMVLFYTRVMKMRYSRNSSEIIMSEQNPKYVKTKQDTAILSFDREDRRDTSAIELVCDYDADFFANRDMSNQVAVGYSVPQLEDEVKRLREEHDQVVEYQDGAVVAWMLDPEGNRVEIWEDGEWVEAVKTVTPTAMAKNMATERGVQAERKLLYVALPTPDAVAAASYFSKWFDLDVALVVNATTNRGRKSPLSDDGNFVQVRGTAMLDVVRTVATVVLFRQQKFPVMTTAQLEKDLTRNEKSNFRYISFVMNESLVEFDTELNNLVQATKGELVLVKLISNESAILECNVPSLSGYRIKVLAGHNFYTQARREMSSADYVQCLVWGGCFPDQMRRPSQIASFIVHVSNATAAFDFYENALRMTRLREEHFKGKPSSYFYGFGLEGENSGNVTTLQLIADLPQRTLAAGDDGRIRQDVHEAYFSTAEDDLTPLPRSTYSSIAISIFDSLRQESNRLRQALFPFRYNASSDFISIADPDGNWFEIWDDARYRSLIIAFNNSYRRQAYTGNRQIIFARVPVSNLNETVEFFTQGGNMRVMRASDDDAAASFYVYERHNNRQTRFVVLGYAPFEGSDNSSALYLEQTYESRTSGKSIYTPSTPSKPHPVLRPVELNILTRGPFKSQIDNVITEGLERSANREATVTAISETRATVLVKISKPPMVGTSELPLTVPFVLNFEREYRLWFGVRKAYKVHPPLLTVDFTPRLPFVESKGVQRILYTTIRVNDIDKQLNFYVNVMKMMYLRYNDSNKPFTASYFVGYQKEDYLFENSTTTTNSVVYSRGTTSIELQRDWKNTSKFTSTSEAVTSITITVSGSLQAEVDRIKAAGADVEYNATHQPFATVTDPEGNVLYLWDEHTYMVRVRRHWPNLERIKGSTIRTLMSINLHVLDVRVAVDFYTKAYQMTVVRSEDSNHTVWMGYNLEGQRGAVLKLHQTLGRIVAYEKGWNNTFGGVTLAVGGRDFYQSVQLDLVDTRLGGDNSSVVFFPKQGTWLANYNQVTMKDPDGWIQMLYFYRNYLNDVAKGKEHALPGFKSRI